MKRSRASFTRMTKRNHQRNFPQALIPGGALSPPSLMAVEARIGSCGGKEVFSDMVLLQRVRVRTRQASRNGPRTEQDRRRPAESARRHGHLRKKKCLKW